MSIDDILKPSDQKVAKENVVDFFRLHGFEVVPEYVDFLVKYNGGVLRSSDFIVRRELDSGFQQEFYLDEIYPLSQLDIIYNIFYVDCIDVDVPKERIFPFATTNGSTLICLGLGSANFGKVFLWDGDFGITNHSKSIAHFFSSITSSR